MSAAGQFDAHTRSMATNNTDATTKKKVEIVTYVILFVPSSQLDLKLERFGVLIVIYK